ncbi:MAG: hypothetical protein ACREMZ_17625 [Gemmatimonadales bacterium]
MAGITDKEAANRYLWEVYRPAYNAEFKQPAAEEGSAFVPFIGQELTDILCEQFILYLIKAGLLPVRFERTVGKDNCVSFEGTKLQIPADRHRMHYVKVKVRVHRYPDGRVALFHGPRRLADYDAKGRLLASTMKAAA